MTVCTFAGHRDIFDSQIERKIQTTLKELLHTDTEFVFYTGGMGEFDHKCAAAVRRAKREMDL